MREREKDRQRALEREIEESNETEAQGGSAHAKIGGRLLSVQ